MKTPKRTHPTPASEAARRRAADYAAAKAAGALRNGRLLQRGGAHGPAKPRAAASARACRGPADFRRSALDGRCETA